MIYAIDMDGVLCSVVVNHDYEKSTPNYKVIQKVNRLYKKGHTIKIFTARGSSSGIDWKKSTIRQLKLWGVKYHELILGKPSYDLLIDDKAINIKDWI